MKSFLDQICCLEKQIQALRIAVDGGGEVTDVTQLTFAPDAWVQVTGSRNLTDADNGKILYSTSGSNFTLTVPNGLALPFAITLAQESTGALIVAAGGGMTLAPFDSGVTQTAGAGAFANVSVHTGTVIRLYGQTA